MFCVSKEKKISVPSKGNTQHSTKLHNIEKRGNKKHMYKEIYVQKCGRESSARNLGTVEFTLVGKHKCEPWLGV